jgi:hypothetical protein
MDYLHNLTKASKEKEYKESQDHESHDSKDQKVDNLGKDKDKEVACVANVAKECQTKANVTSEL